MAAGYQRTSSPFRSGVACDGDSMPLLYGMRPTGGRIPDRIRILVRPSDAAHHDPDGVLLRVVAQRNRTAGQARAVERDFGNPVLDPVRVLNPAAVSRRPEPQLDLELLPPGGNARVEGERVAALRDPQQRLDGGPVEPGGR